MDGLVGKKYPGSTGGEIFNYYDTDSNKNVASGDYSTAKGRKNQALGQYSFVAGYNNKIKGQASVGLGYANDSGNANVKANGTLLMGYGNSVQNTSTYCSGNVLLGSNNSMPSNGGDAQYNVIVGRDNSIESRHVGSVLCGNGLYTSSSMALNVCIYGVENKTTTSLTDPIVIIGCGQNNVKKTAIEISNTQCKIRNNLQLEYDDTEVNAITPPQDPNNVTTDDQTLVTKSYVKNLSDVAKVHGMWADSLPNSVTLPADGSTIAFAYGGIYDEPPEWATRVQVTFIWEGEYFTPIISLDRTGGIHLDVKQTDTSMQPDLVIRHAHVRLDYQSAGKTLQILDYWEYSHNITTNTISNIVTGISNAATVYVYNINYMN